MVESPLRKGHRQHKTSGLVHGLGHLIWRNKVHVYQVGWLGEYSLVHQLSSMVPPVVSPYNLYDSIKKKVICKLGKSWIVYPYWGICINPLILNSDSYTHSGRWFQTFFIFHNIWDSPSHWLIFSRWLKPPAGYLIRIHIPITMIPILGWMTAHVFFPSFDHGTFFHHHSWRDRVHYEPVSTI